MEYIPSYDNYKEILRLLIASEKLCDYQEALARDEFIVLRHDIEFSIERAYRMSLIETALGVKSTYFVQLTNNAYNALSLKNRELIRNMHNNGHRIGLHYHFDPEKVACINDDIMLQMKVLSEFYGFEIDSFSMHRPNDKVAYYDINIDGVINAYSEAFFTFLRDAGENSDVKIKYIADSKHRWNYGCPDAETLRRFPKIQLLIHPDFWSETGFDAKNNFVSLIGDSKNEFIETIDNECFHFNQFKEDIKESNV